MQAFQRFLKHGFLAEIIEQKHRYYLKLFKLFQNLKLKTPSEGRNFALVSEKSFTQ